MSVAMLLTALPAFSQSVSATTNGNTILVTVSSYTPNSNGFYCTYAKEDPCSGLAGGYCSSGPHTDTIEFECNDVGPHTVQGCWGIGPTFCSDPIPVTVTVPVAPPGLDVSIQKLNDGTYTATVTYAAASSCGSTVTPTVSLSLLPTATEPGQTYFTQTVSSGNGKIVQPLGTFDTTRTIQATAISCGGATATKDATITCNKCKGPATSTPDPIRLFDGVMTHSETDPLPATFGFEFRREYASSAVLDGRFGLGWSSLFDAGAIPTDGQATRVSVVTENRSHASFVKNSDGSWTQAWPLDDAAGTLTGSEASGYTFRDASGSLIRTFDATHHLTRLQDLRSGRAVSITYDTNGWPTRVFDEAGSWSATVTAGAGHITQIAVDGRPDLTWTYSYTGSLLTSVSVAGAPTAWRTYAYVNNRLTSVADATGTVIVRHDYDALGRAITSYDSDGGDITNIAYGVSDANGVSSTVITRADNSQATYDQSFAGGSVVTQHVDNGCASCGQSDATAVYDAYGNVIRLQNGRGYITASTYTGGRQLYQTTTAEVPSGCDPATDAAHCRLSSAALAAATLLQTSASQTTTYTYGDPNWPGQPTQISRIGVRGTSGNRSTVTETFAYDPTTGSALTHAITGAINDQLTTETHTTTTSLYGANDPAAFAPGGAFQSSWLSLPQPSGLKKSIDGPRTDVNDVTTFVYYPYDAGVPGAWRGRLAAVRNALGHITRYEDYDVFGNAGTIVDPNGTKTQSTFDALGRTVSSTIVGVSGCDTNTDPLCATNLTTTRTYASVTGPLLSEQRPSGDLTTYTYDSRGRILTLTRGTSTTPLERTTHTYDPTTGKKSTETVGAWENGSWVTKKNESYAYFSDGNLSAVTRADNTSVRYTYLPDGTLGTVQDENHSTPNTSYTYDPANRLQKLTQTLGSASGGQAVTQYTYDIAGDLASVIDPNNNTTAYRYDDFGRLIQQDSPVSGTTTYGYDLAGNLVTTTDANGASTSRTYDALNRVLSAASTRGGNTETISWTYDDAAAAHYGIGRLATMTDPTGSTAYQYEHRGQLRSESKTINSATYTTAYAYDANGNRNRVTYPTGLIAQYTFDFADRPYSLSAGGTTIVTSATYLPFGPLTNVAFGNGTTRTMRYDNRYRPQENRLTGPGGTIADYTYQEDNVGNITQIHDATDPTFNRDFGYDDLNRLTTANSGASLWGAGTYTYDAMGNMTSSALGSWKQTTATLAGTTPKLTSMLENGSSRSVAYDSAGNEVTVGASTFSYSPRNHLIAADAASYVYDGRGVLTISSAPPVLLSVPTTIHGGSTGTGTVTIGGAVGLDTTVALSSGDPSVIVPASVSITAGSTSATFAISTTTVATNTSVTITATANGNSATGTTTVLAPQLVSVSVSPASARAGDPVSATVTLENPAGVATIVVLTGQLVGEPVNAVVPQGSATGTVTVTPQRLFLPSPATRTISATLDGVTRTTTLTVTPPSLTAFSVSPTSVTGGSTSTAQATVSGTAGYLPTEGMPVRVTSTDPSLAGVVGAQVGMSNATSATGQVLTAPVASTTSVVLTGSTDTASQSSSLTLQPVAVTIASFSVSPTSIVGTNPVNGTVTLTAPAPAGGLDVEITSNVTAASSAIAYVHVAAGSTSATFQINTLAVASTTTATITATHAATSRTATLTVNAAKGAYLAALIAPIYQLAVPNGYAVTGGDSLGAEVQLGGGTGRASVSLTSSNTALLTVPKSVTVNNGMTSVDFTITTVAVSTPSTVKITATYNGTVQALYVTLLPPNGVTIQSLNGFGSIQGSQTISGWINLTGPAPSGGAVISISGSRPGLITFDPSVTIPAGATTGYVQMSSVAFLGTQHATDLTATYLGVTQTQRVVISPVTLSAYNRDRRTVQCAALSIAPCLTGAELHAVAKAVGDASRYYLYTPELQLLAETEQSTSSSKALAYAYLWFGEQPVAQIDRSNTVHWYMTDHLGTPFMQTDAASAVVWRAEFAPYGDVMSEPVGSALHQPLRFPGQFLTDATADHYNVFRWYRGGWGQYTQVDPKGLKAGINLFSYAAANPQAFIDPMGLQSKCKACDQCPSGKWYFKNGASTYSAGIFKGGSVTTGTLVCKDSNMSMMQVAEVEVKIVCEWKGLMVGAGVSYAGPVPLFPNACGCNENEVFHSGGKGWTFSAGPVSADWGACGGGTSLTPALGYSAGGGLAKTQCEVYPNWNKL